MSQSTAHSLFAEGDFAACQKRCQRRVDAALAGWLQPPTDAFAPLWQAMHYSVLSGGGKRIRPLLVYAACEALGGALDKADGAACAVELIHAYSLVHDDLPAMDDDDLRRGQPTCHRVYGEALAILAGNSLQSLAFAVLTAENGNPADSQTRLAMLSTLARAAGACGLQAGQAIDLAAVGKKLTQSELAQMHRHKTGALIEASVRLGALASLKAGDRELQALQDYASAIGLAFQVQDDILDVAGDTQTLGKTKGKDKLLDKPSFAELLGLAGAEDYARRLCEQAKQALSAFDERATPLRQLASYIVERRS